MRRGTDQPVTITDAERSQRDQLRTRQTRYLVMMSVRILCLVAAAVVVSAQPPLLWLWLSLCAAGMILLPWIAVVLANDRLPKERHRWRRDAPAPADRQLPRGRPAQDVAQWDHERF